MISKSLRNLVLFLLIVASNVSHFLAKPTATGLYDVGDDKDAVFELSSKTYDKRVLASSNAWLMQFYNSWCGHCIHFAPTYRDLAKDIKGWRDVISLGSVDCAQEVNMDLCKAFNVKMFPTLMIIPANSIEKKVGEMVKQHSTTEAFREDIVRILSNETLSQLPPASQRLFQPISNSNELWSGIKRSVTDLSKTAIFSIVLEKETSFMGRQVILDLLGEKRLIIRWSTAELFKEISTTDTEGLFFVDPATRKFSKIFGGPGNRTDYERLLRNLLSDNSALESAEKLKDSSQVSSPSSSIKSGEEEISNAMARSYLRLHSQDLVSGIRYSLTHEVSLQTTLNTEQLNTLKHYIRILALYAPVPDAIASYLFSITDWLDSVNTNQMSGDDWLKQIKSLQGSDWLFETTNEWTGCAGSAPHYRGYPCSLWMTFHALTVASYNNEFELYEGLKVLQTIRGFIDHFFSCRECRNHFLNATTDILNTPQPSSTTNHLNSAESVLYLWRIHNAVNRRLAGGGSSDPEHPKLQFPTVRQCLMCHQSARDTETWDEGRVLKFLVDMYSESSVVQDWKKPTGISGKEISGKLFLNSGNSSGKTQHGGGLLRRKRMMKVKESVEDAGVMYEKVGNDDYITSRILTKFGMNKIDIGMCVMFYCFCTVVLILGYVHLCRRRWFNVGTKLPL